MACIFSLFLASKQPCEGEIHHFLLTVGALE
uniref:Uncharacterized protein n=1 Tax=Rhizophora mucronata TaxID=61149 RepID=A0A2P2Q0I4_RHIMU